jgi:hypothetical protein
LRTFALALAASAALHVALAALPGPEAGPPGPAQPPLRVALAKVAADERSPHNLPRTSMAKRAGHALPVRYYTAAEVDIKATPLALRNSVRTSDNFPLGRIARAKLRLFINEQGVLDSYQVLEAERLPDRSLLDDFRQVRFRPAERGGHPVKSQKVVEISFVP